MGERYVYMVCRDRKIPSLIRLGSFARMEADLYAYPGVWKDTPHLNDIRVGKGCFMDYDDVTDEEAEEIRLQIQAQYDRMAKIRVYVDMDPGCTLFHHRMLAKFRSEGLFDIVVKDETDDDPRNGE